MSVTRELVAIGEKKEQLRKSAQPAPRLPAFRASQGGPLKPLFSAPLPLRRVQRACHLLQIRVELDGVSKILVNALESFDPALKSYFATNPQIRVIPSVTIAQASLSSGTPVSVRIVAMESSHGRERFDDTSTGASSLFQVLLFFAFTSGLHAHTPFAFGIRFEEDRSPAANDLFYRTNRRRLKMSRFEVIRASSIKRIEARIPDGSSLSDADFDNLTTEEAAVTRWFRYPPKGQLPLLPQKLRELMEQGRLQNGPPSLFASLFLIKANYCLIAVILQTLLKQLSNRRPLSHKKAM